MAAERMTVISPEGSMPRHEHIRAAPPLDALPDAHVAFLGNTKNNVDLLFAELGGRLRQRVGAAFEVTRKANSTVGAGPLIRELSARAHGIVSGMGD